MVHCSVNAYVWNSNYGLVYFIEWGALCVCVCALLLLSWLFVCIICAAVFLCFVSFESSLIFFHSSFLVVVVFRWFFLFIVCHLNMLFRIYIICNLWSINIFYSYTICVSVWFVANCVRMWSDGWWRERRSRRKRWWQRRVQQSSILAIAVSLCLFIG